MRAEYSLAGQDPLGYSDVATMLKRPPQRTISDARANELIGALEAQLSPDSGWPDRVWKALDDLKGVNVSPNEVAALRQAARKLVDATRKAGNRADARKAFLMGNGHYQMGKFANAVSAYRTALSKCPRYEDAWNNMALAEMHAGNDLVALFEFAGLAQAVPKYAGAAVNLTVCLERLGMEAEAAKQAQSLAGSGSDVPSVLYNAAWFSALQGDRAGATALITRAKAKVHTYIRADRLREALDAEAGLLSAITQLAKRKPTSSQVPWRPQTLIVKVRKEGAAAYSGSTFVTTIPKDTQLTISATAGSWIAVYWPVNHHKRRLWIRRSQCTP